MSVQAKICGIRDTDSLGVAIEGGAALVGFVFYPPSPRSLPPAAAGALARQVPDSVRRVGLFVDETDETIQTVLAEVELDMLQFHGAETPARVAEARNRFERPIAKAISVAGRDDIARASAYEEVADLLLFDAKAPKRLADALPGGNGLIFDWNLLAGRDAGRPWMLSGGLDAGNVGDAVRISGAPMVDVSSGVETVRWQKDPALIKAFLDVTNTL